MTNYIQFPRYCLFLLPDKNFANDFNNFCEKNSVDNSILNKSIYGFHSTVKAPFYLSHLYSENLILEQFQNIDNKKFVEGINNQLIKDKLKELTTEAFNKELFGAPTYVANNKIFWGQDRLEYAVDEVSSN